MKLVDKDNNSVNFGDCLVGRINYNVHYGFLVKIKKQLNVIGHIVLISMGSVLNLIVVYMIKILFN